MICNQQGFRCFDQNQHWTSHIVPWRTLALNPGVFAISVIILFHIYIQHLHACISVPLINRRKFHPENLCSPPISLSPTLRWFIAVILLGNSHSVFVICIEVRKSDFWPVWSLWLVVKWLLQKSAKMLNYLLRWHSCVCFWSICVLECFSKNFYVFKHKTLHMWGLNW